LGISAHDPVHLCDHEEFNRNTATETG
jgi:hypothetical protein